MEREGSVSALLRGVASDGAVLTPRALRMDRTSLILEDMVSHMPIGSLHGN